MSAPPKATAYLSGAIDLAPDFGTSWRRHVGDYLRMQQLEVADPIEMQLAVLGLSVAQLGALRTSDPVQFRQDTLRMIEHDLSFVARRATCVIARIDAHVRMGTYAEISVAHLWGVPIFLLASDLPAVSGWCESCAQAIFDSEQAMMSDFDQRGASSGTLAQHLLQLHQQQHGSRVQAGLWPVADSYAEACSV